VIVVSPAAVPVVNVVVRSAAMATTVKVAVTEFATAGEARVVPVNVTT